MVTYKTADALREIAREVPLEKLLVETDYPLKRIAEIAGFEHVEYLSVVFKRLSGSSPGVYRKNSQSKQAG